MEFYVFYYDGYVDKRQIEICGTRKEARAFIKAERLKNGNKRRDYEIIKFGKVLPKKFALQKCKKNV